MGRALEKSAHVSWCFLTKPDGSSSLRRDGFTGQLIVILMQTHLECQYRTIRAELEPQTDEERRLLRRFVAPRMTADELFKGLNCVACT